MATVTFYEKPGCEGNARQKKLLAASGHTVQAKSLKAETWTAERLLAFFRDLPVTEWFNRSAPAIKARTIVPEQLCADDAMQLLLGDPLLIRRPLMEVGEERMVGFDTAAVDAWLGLADIELSRDLESCARGETDEPRCKEVDDAATAGQ